jgi:peptide/nickel transport system ATP-binding protein
MTQTVLQIENLETHYLTKSGVVKAVNRVSFSLKQGEILGLVGESGSGKSQTGYSIMGLIDKPGRIAGGRVLLRGKDLALLNEEQWRQLRGNRIAMIFQDPMLTLNPVLRIDTQMIEAVQAHRAVSSQRAREIARDVLSKVGIPSPDERLMAYPHQFSGGMRQRVAIAIALIHEPDVIIADEPTTALDVTIQEQILFEIRQLTKKAGTALIWITHDLSVVAGLADHLAVMYAGSIVESGPIAQVLKSPAHPYTAGLMRSAPCNNRRGQSLYQIAGHPPLLSNLPSGCSFEPRCDRSEPACQKPVSNAPISAVRTVRCIKPLSPELEQYAKEPA